MAYSLTNKVAIITGASSGIGKALAEILIQKGAKVSLCARNFNQLQDTYQKISPENILLKCVDVAQEDQCKKWIEETIAKFGRIDILINNAGMSMRALFRDVDLSVLDNLMKINFWGTVFMTKYALPHIVKTKGSITGISSIAGYRGLPARTGYCASKFAMTGFLTTLRVELLKDDVHIMIASPGFTASNIRNTSMTADGSAQTETPLNESKLMSAEECAGIIVNGIENRKREIIMTNQGRFTVFLTRLFPALMDKVVYNHFKKEPNSPLK